MSIDELQETLARLVGAPVQITVTDNRHSMVSIRKGASGYRVRVHHMFVAAERRIWQALAEFIKSSTRKAPDILAEFVEANSDKIRRQPPRRHRVHLRPTGQYFDLQEIFNRLNQDYFQGKLCCRITWGARRRLKQKKTIRLGSYSEKTGIIRVNAALDRSFVPAYVIEGVVYHEMLHHHLGVEVKNGRRYSHSRLFRQLEARYPHHQKVTAWINKRAALLSGER
ncbi:MAG: hypothetical protein JRJ12_00455 [Deltaproteobacteria bacterium]|nr:hypothetical protein [Deltaproteobacteria bacterium]MBW2069836.1 hypothetical protein [Deltaproteobacteria bacterium]